MAYELHIERPDGDISLEEWSSAVAQVEGVRLTDQDAVGVNPSTREEVRIPSAHGDTEVLFESGGFLGLGRKKQWGRVFRFSQGRATFRATESVESPGDPAHIVAAKLASLLGASIVGDEGEVYEW